jgi:hypothetical protein
MCLKNIVTINDAVTLTSSESVNNALGIQHKGRVTCHMAESHGEHARKAGGPAL